MYAVEASEMADYARKLIAGNPLLAERITVRPVVQFSLVNFPMYIHLSDVLQCGTWVGDQGKN